MRKSVRCNPSHLEAKVLSGLQRGSRVRSRRPQHPLHDHGAHESCSVFPLKQAPSLRDSIFELGQESAYGSSRTLSRRCFSTSCQDTIHDVTLDLLWIEAQLLENLLIVFAKFRSTLRGNFTHTLYLN